jgi:hypothetical protein
VIALGAALVGFVSSFLFSSVLQFARPVFVAAHALSVGAFSAAYALSRRVNLWSQLKRRWLAGLVGGVALGVLLVVQVQGQPASARADGVALLGQLVWIGVAYGTVDALLLSVLPVLAIYGSRPAPELQRAGARWRWALLALIGSALVTAAYHAGFREYRGPQLLQPVFGNIVMTLVYLVTGNPLAAIVSHVMMHGAAVLHGMETTSQLPPHY